MTPFAQRLSAAGLLGVTKDRQQAAIGELLTRYEADGMATSWPPARDGSRRVTLWKHGDRSPVCKATVFLDGQVLEDVTEVIA